MLIKIANHIVESMFIISITDIGRVKYGEFDGFNFEVIIDSPEIGKIEIEEEIIHTMNTDKFDALSEKRQKTYSEKIEFEAYDKIEFRKKLLIEAWKGEQKEIPVI